MGGVGASKGFFLTTSGFSKDARDDAMASLTILRQRVTPPPTGAEGRGLGSRIHAHFAALGGVELDLPDRASMAEATGFDPEPA